MLDPMHFDANAAVYERARPPYPAGLWQRLADLGLLGSHVRVLELGAGSGQATERLLETCATVTAIEPGRALARRLREHLPRAEVLQMRAEDAVFADGAFDLAVAATSIHWLDLDVVVPNLHRALSHEGHVAVWRTAFGDPTIDTPFRERVRALTSRRIEPAQRPDADGLDTGYWVRRLTEGKLFTEIHVEHFRWSIDLRADQIHDLFSTFSNWTAAEVDEAAAAVRELGGHVTEHYVTPLIVLWRSPSPSGRTR